jgi:DNA-binding IclR family transcriptional regulator
VNPTIGGTERVVAVLNELATASDRGVGVREMAASIDVSRSSVHRILTALAEAEVAEIDERGRYRPGLTFIRWVSRLSREDLLMSMSGSLVQKLVDQFGETAYVFTHVPPKWAECLSVEQSGKPIRYSLRPGEQIPLFLGCGGRAILAFVEDVDSALEPAGGFAPRDRKLLERQLAQVRREGYALSVGERVEGSAGIAAPFFRNGLIAGSVGVSMPYFRLDMDRKGWYAETVIEAASELSACLSGEGLASLSRRRALG